MVILNNEHDQHLEGGYFSTYRKNLGNKLFIYGVSRVIADKLDYDLILPEESYIRRELFNLGYQVEVFPYSSITGRQSVEGKPVVVDDLNITFYENIEEFLEKNQNKPIEIKAYFTMYRYVKPYKDQIKSYFTDLVKPKRNQNDIVIMLRNSNHDSRFTLPDEYYLDILDKESFDNVYVCYDHFYKHFELIEKLKKYKPIYLEGSILSIFKEITSFNKIIASQGTFSFWACFLSNAETIYWPLTDDGPNSNNEIFIKGVDLLVDDEDRYKTVNLKTK